jgi:murein DD-endopeptidase MepM/ murein hydrolase activator NlpD
MAVAAVGTGSFYTSGGSASGLEARPDLDRNSYEKFASLGDHLENGTILTAPVDTENADAGVDQVAVPERDGATEYTVVEGDQLRQIAAKFGLRTSTLIWANDLSNPDLIYPGDVLTIPPTDGLSVEVQEGDTLRDIATQYGVSITTIINYEPNGITDPDLIYPGQILTIPGGMQRASESQESESDAEQSEEPAEQTSAEFQEEAEPEVPEGIEVEVRSGDTLLKIAKRHGVDVSAIVDFGPNGITDPNSIFKGQKLFIPGGTEASEPVAEFQEESEAEVINDEPEPEPTPDPEPEPEPEPEPDPEPASDAGVANGNFIWPTEGVITQRFGHTSFSQSSGWYGSSGHTGLDIANRTNTPIKAADGGTVIVSGWSGGYGYAVAIDHGNGYVTWYAHMAQQPPVSVGQKVSRGEYIGPMGSTGYSTGPHLHFEIRKNGNYQDPLTYLGSR